MKPVKFLAMAFAALLFTNTQAQTVDDVVNSHITAMGGKEKLESLKSVRMTGSMSTQGVDISMTMTRSHLIGFRLDMDIMGSSNYQMLNATEGWVFMPVMGMTEPKKMEDDQYKSASSQLDIQGALLNYKDKGTTIELLGKDKVDNAEAYKLKLTLKSGKVVTYFLDAKTYFLIKTASKQNVQGEEMDMETTFADFKQNADGFWFPYSTTSMQGTITFDKIETNVKVEDSLFKN
ncbi:MAG: hypothetical protein U0T56_07530 [Ferruginibacter sp.]|jgi:outer membrane lipoprotein-sorting protein